MGSITVPALVAGGLSAAGSVASGVLGAGAAKSAANTQTAAANSATALQEQEFNQTQAELQPFIYGGTDAFNVLQNFTGTNIGGNPLTAPLTAQFQPTQAQLAATPGYQFTLDQGLKSTQNSFAAQGLGTSGAAAKGAANYAEGLASTTYQNQFNNYLAGNLQTYNELAGLANTGENAAAGAGSLGNQATNSIANTISSAGAATAAGTIGSTNALTSGISGVANAGANTAVVNAFLSANPGLYNAGTGGGGNAFQ